MNLPSPADPIPATGLLAFHLALDRGDIDQAAAILQREQLLALETARRAKRRNQYDVALKIAADRLFNNKLSICA